MAGDINRVTIVGRLTRDPELRHLPSGTAVLQLGVAVNGRQKDDAGNWIDPTHLRPNRGDEVLNKIKDAIQKLSDLIESKKSKIPDPVLQDFINRLLQDARLLAQAAIIDANSADSKLMEIAKANEALSLGDAEAAVRKYNQGMDDYRDAWLHAQKAIS